MKSILLAALILVSGACSGCGPGVPSSAGDLGKQILLAHPDWKAKSATPMFSYLLAKDHAEVQPSTYNGEWSVQSPLAEGSLETIREAPFEESAWKGIVLIRLYPSAEDKQGWHGAALVKGSYLFYGDRTMIQQIDRDLP